MKQCTEVVQGRAQEQKTCVERLVGDVLSGVVEVLVCVFNVAQKREVRLETIVAERDDFVVDFLGAVVCGAYWEPIFYVRVQGVLYRLPDLGVPIVVICQNFAFSTVGSADVCLASSCR